MPGVSGVTVVTNARVYYTPRAAAGAPGARHSLRPLFGEGQIFMKTSGASRRENVDLRLAVIASAAKQSILFFARPDGLLRFARNDGLKYRVSQGGEGAHRHSRDNAAHAHRHCEGCTSCVASSFGRLRIIL